jgi:phage-related protein
MISSGVAGPLGVLHLPRLWLKSSLEARGKLAPGYPGCGSGYDQMVLDGLNINREAFLNFIKNEKPTYPQVEAWIKKQPGARLDRDSIEKLNSAIRGYIHKDEVRSGVFAANGLTDESCSFRDAVNLNNLDDWKEYHEAVLK